LRDFGDHFGPSVIIRNETAWPVVVFLCADAEDPECIYRGWDLNPRSSTRLSIAYVVRSGDQFIGQVVAASSRCAVLSRARFASDGDDFAVVVDEHAIEGRNRINTYSEWTAPGFAQQENAGRRGCSNIGGGDPRHALAAPRAGRLLVTLTNAE
jgi:hypothetical protein